MSLLQLDYEKCLTRLTKYITTNNILIIAMLVKNPERISMHQTRLPCSMLRWQWWCPSMCTTNKQYSKGTT